MVKVKKLLFALHFEGEKYYRLEKTAMNIQSDPL